MRILGLDPGSRFTGFGCIEGGGSSWRIVEHGRIRCEPKDPLPARLGHLSRELAALVDRLEPEVAVLEQAFRGVNSRSLIVLAHARGALLVTLAQRPIRIEEFTPAEVKSAVAGNGRAGKDQVARMVCMLLGIQGQRLTSDASDALAVALCWTAHRPFRAAAATAEALC